MNFEEIVNKFVEKPCRITTGAPSLSKRWGVDLDLVYQARAVAKDILKNKEEFGTEYTPEDVAFNGFTNISLNNIKDYEGKEVAVMSYGGGSRHLKWRHIRTKTEQLSGRNKNCIRLHLFFLREIYNPYYEERTRDAGSQRIRKYIHAYGVAIW